MTSVLTLVWHLLQVSQVHQDQHPDAGSLGCCLGLALRPGVPHSAAESQYNFERALLIAVSLVLALVGASLSSIYSTTPI